MTRTHHGDVFVDPYEWLRDKDNPEVISYLEAENAYTEAQTAHLSELSDAVFSEIKARTKETDLSVPSYTSHPGGSAYWYYVRTVEGSEYPIYCRLSLRAIAKSPHPEREIVGEEVLDANLEAEGHEFLSRCVQCVPRRATAGVLVDLTGAERFTIMIKDLVSGLLPDQISDTAYGVAWAKTHLFHQSGRSLAAVRRLATSPGQRPVARRRSRHRVR